LLKVSDPDIRERRIAAGAISMSKFEAMAGNTSADFFRNLLEDAQQALEEFIQLTNVLEGLCGEQDGYPQSPPSSSIKKALEECCDRIRSVSKDVVGVADAETASELVEGVGGELVPTADGMAVPTGERAMTRASALELLRKIADFFEHTEPHSPVSYSLRQVVSWGKMSLPQLLAELISDQQTRDELSKRAGIPFSDEDSN
jgi:type VI secretion system protein ImpA